MPSITGVPVIATKDSTGTVIQPLNLALRFDGATVTVDGLAQTLITVGGGGGGGWETAGNALTGGEVFGSTGASAIPDVVGVYSGTEYWRMNATGMNWSNSQFDFNFVTTNISFGNIPANLIVGGSCSFLFGDTAGSGSIKSLANGTLSFGQTMLSGIIQATASASSAFGYSENSNAEISANGQACLAHGYAINGKIIASNLGAEASGSVTNNSTIQSYGFGSYAHGVALNNSNIYSYGDASFANGYVAAGLLMSNAAAGAFCSGYAGFGSITVGVNALGSMTIAYTNFGSVVNNGRGSIVVGDNIDNQASYSQVFGIGTRGTYGSIVAGRYPLALGNSSAWVSTDPLLLLGNGTAVSRKDAYRIDKDGLQYQTAAEINTAIVPVGSGVYNINARTNRTMVCSLTGAGGTMNLPAGVNGQIFTFTTGGAGAAVWNLVPNGADVLDNAVPTTINSTFSIQFSSVTGTWYKV